MNTHSPHPIPKPHINGRTDAREGRQAGRVDDKRALGLDELGRRVLDGQRDAEDVDVEERAQLVGRRVGQRLAGALVALGSEGESGREEVNKSGTIMKMTIENNDCKRE